MSDWDVPIAALVERQVGEVESRFRNTTYNLFRAIVERSPVDTGRFISNWNVSTGAPDYSYSPGNHDIIRAVGEVEKVLTLNTSQGFFIANGAPYGQLLEYGYSQKAPIGMIRISIAELSQHAREML